MKVEVLADTFTVCKVTDYREIDLSLPYCFTGRTDKESSLVIPTARAPRDTLAREDGWRGFRLVGQLDFSLVGILARIAALLAEAGISIFAVPTYDTDYVFLKKENFTAALQLLAENGYTLC
ncbi:MAG: ACT domain-containing protein [Clostridiales bacterium]|nr:ACT domain-containing protein [Clostridiales bacterium]